MLAIRAQPDGFAKVNAIRAKHNPFYLAVAALLRRCFLSMELRPPLFDGRDDPPPTRGTELPFLDGFGFFRLRLFQSRPPLPLRLRNPFARRLN